MPLDNYPTKIELGMIRKWPFMDEKGWLDYCLGLWTFDGWATKRGGNYRFATGGWSGNEDIIEAMQANMGCWMSTWRSSHRGGLYKFQIPKKRLTKTKK